MGLKFIPCNHFNLSDMFFNLLIDLDKELINLNKKLIIFNKRNNKNNSELENNKINSDKTRILQTMSDNTTDWNCDHIDCIVNKLKTQSRKAVFNELNFELSKDIINLRFDIIKNIPNYYKNYKSNVSLEQFKILRSFNKTRNFSIIDTDKNTGAVIVSNQICDELALSHLNNVSIYECIDHNPTNTTFQLITESLNELKFCNNISSQLYNLIKPTTKNGIGKFRILAKLHKSKFGIRPIINCKNHLTEKISIFIDLVLKPILIQTETYLKDSTQLLQIFNSIKIDKTLFLYSCDFESLYTNIKLQDAIDITMDVIINSINSVHIDSTGFNKLLQLVLLNNVFQYQSKYFKQINGLAMGSNLGPTVASIVVYKLEQKWLYVYKPLIYKRFIDDIFIASVTEVETEILAKSFLYLKLNIVCGNSVQFLDLIIEYDSICNRIITSLYIKPTNTFAYLKTNSNHPSFVFENIPRCLFTRIKRICTKLVDYFYHSRLIYTQLIQQGYDSFRLKKLIYIIANLNRNDLIEYKNKTRSNFIDNRLFVFKLTYNNSLDSKSLIKKALQDAIEINNFPNIQLKSIYGVSNNIRDIFIHGKTFAKSCNYNSYKCENNNCECCSFINTQFKKGRIKSPTGLDVPILCNNNCEASECIYILFCTICSAFYIGQTVKFKLRFAKHLSTIRNHIKFKNYKNCEIATHFDSDYIHQQNWKSSLKWTIYIDNISVLKTRLSYEQEIIRLFQSLEFKTMNLKLAFNSINTFNTNILRNNILIRK